MKTAMFPGSRGVGGMAQPGSQQRWEIFLELWGQGAHSIMVALLIKCKPETAGGHLVITRDKCLESAMPEANYFLTCQFPEPIFFSFLTEPA